MAHLKCPLGYCRHTMKVHSLTPNDLYFCKCTDSEVLKVTERPGFYGGKEKVLVQASETERAEFLARAPESEWPRSPHAPSREEE